MAWYDFPITQQYNPPKEYGVDIGTPFHTPITDVLPGTVERAYYAANGGNVVIAAQIPGIGQVNEYFQHLDTIASNLVAGAQVQAGQFLGLSGGQLAGGYAPNSPQFSSGPHTEFGFGAPWQGGGPNFDPAPYLPNSPQILNPGGAQILTGGPLTSTSQNPPQGGGSLPWWCGPPGSLQSQFAPGCSTTTPTDSLTALENAVTGFINEVPKIGLILGAILLIFIGLWSLLKKPEVQIEGDKKNG